MLYSRLFCIGLASRVSSWDREMVGARISWHCRDGMACMGPIQSYPYLPGCRAIYTGISKSVYSICI